MGCLLSCGNLLMLENKTRILTCNKPNVLVEGNLLTNTQLKQELQRKEAKTVVPSNS